MAYSSFGEASCSRSSLWVTVALAVLSSLRRPAVGPPTHCKTRIWDWWPHKLSSENDKEYFSSFLGTLTQVWPIIHTADGPRVGMGAAFWWIKLILANLSIFVTPAFQLLRLRQAVPSTSLSPQTMKPAQWRESKLPQMVAEYNPCVGIRTYTSQLLMFSNNYSNLGN